MPPATAPFVIVNPAAGNGRARRLVPWLTRELAGAGSGSDLVLSRGPGHATELARNAAAAGHDRVVAVGGDGTVQEIVNGLVGHPGAPTLGILPGGSGNDLARSLGLPRSQRGALAAALGAEQVRIDLGRAANGVRQRVFASAGGVGFDAQVAAAMAGHHQRWQRGAVGYLLSTLIELRRFRNQEVRITLDDREPFEQTVLFVAVANGPYYGGGMRICPGARVDDGLLDLCVVGDISRFEAVKQLPGIYRGRHVDHPAVSFHQARRIRIDGDAGTLAHLDGEPFGRLPITIEALPGVVEVATAGQAVPSSDDPDA